MIESNTINIQYNDETKNYKNNAQNNKCENIEKYLKKEMRNGKNNPLITKILK